jgi:hypothetical protein
LVFDPYSFLSWKPVRKSKTIFWPGIWKFEYKFRNRMVVRFLNIRRPDEFSPLEYQTILFFGWQLRIKPSILRSLSCIRLRPIRHAYNNCFCVCHEGIVVLSADGLKLSRVDCIAVLFGIVYWLN